MKGTCKSSDSQSHQNCESLKIQLLSEIQADKEKLEMISTVKKYTAEIKREIARYNKQIEQKEFLLSDLEAMLTFKPGDWVRNGSTKPGKVIDLKVAGKISEVYVLWWENTVPVPERPKQLQLIDSEQLEYVWNGESNPKLLRRIDRFECEDLEVLAANYQSSKCDRETVYCRKRFNKLAVEKFPAGTRVKIGDMSGTTLDYPETPTKELIQVRVKIDRDEIEKYFVERLFSPLELAVLGDRNYYLPSSPQEENKRNKTLESGLPKIKTIPISDIRRDGGTQQRVSLNHETVIEYAEAMEVGDRFPPVKVKYDGENYWLYDGFHTLEAAWSIGRKEIEAQIISGTQREAILESVGVNAKHGLRRSNADKRRAVTTLLEDKEWGKWSAREIARRCKVHHSTVAKIRQELTGYLASDNRKTYKNKYGNISQMNTENIGKAVLSTSSDSDRSLAVEVQNDNHHENEVSEADKEIITDNVISDTPKTYKNNTEGNPQVCDRFKVGQLVKLKLANFEGVSEELRLANHSYGIIDCLTENQCGFNVSILGHGSFVVSPQDIEPVDQVSICANFSAKEFIRLMSIYKNRDAIEQAIRKGILKTCES